MTVEATPPEFPEPTDDERTSAMLAQILQAFLGFIPPLVILVLKNKSRYVRFHSLQALLWQLISTASFLVGFVVFFILMFVSIASASPGSTGVHMTLFLFPVVWLLFVGQYVTTIVLAIRFGWECSKGKWSQYPLIGRLALRLSK
jgi:uncharacterized Tic20 family protein